MNSVSKHQIRNQTAVVVMKKMDLLFCKDKNTASWREWMGLTAVFVWFFGSMCCFYEPFFSGTWTVLLFMLLLSAGLILSALIAEKRPDLSDGILPFTTIAGAICTGLISYFSQQVGAILYWFSALFMAPMLCRRLYGILVAAKEGARIQTYISTVSATIVVQMVWAMLPWPFKIKFPILSVFALIGLYGVFAHLPEHKREAFPEAAGIRTPVQLVCISIILLLLVLFNIFNTLIHTHVVYDRLEENTWFSLLAWAIVPPSFLFYAYFSDRRKEHIGFLIGVILILLGCFTALIPENGVLTAPLLLTGEFGGTITEFYFLTMPISFFAYSKKPKLAAVSGLITHTLLCSAVSWTQELWLPKSLLQENIGRPLILFGFVCAFLLIPLTFFVWRQQEDYSLMAALLCLKQQTKGMLSSSNSPIQTEIYSNGTQAGEQNWLCSLDLVEGEYRIAQLLCEGLSRSEIAQHMGLPPAKISVYLHNLRTKLENRPPIGYSPEILEIAKQYGLTARETEVMNELLLGRSNAEISANLHIEDTTVKTHVGKVLKKTGMHNRSELIAKLLAEGKLPVS